MAYYGSGGDGGAAGGPAGGGGYGYVQGYPMPPRVRFDTIGEAWALFRQQTGLWIAATILYLVPGTAIGLAMYGLIFFRLFAQGSRLNPDHFLEFELQIWGITLPMMVLLFLVHGYFTGGMCQMALKQMRGAPVGIGDLFPKGKTAGSLIVAGLVGGILVSLGGQLCYIPGIVVGGLFLLVEPIIIEEGLGPFSAMGRSASVLKADLLNASLFYFVLMLLLCVGAMVCGVGVVVAMPLAAIAQALVYRDYFLGGPQTAAPTVFGGDAAGGVQQPWAVAPPPPYGYTAPPAPPAQAPEAPPQPDDPSETGPAA